MYLTFSLFRLSNRKLTAVNVQLVRGNSFHISLSSTVKYSTFADVKHNICPQLVSGSSSQSSLSAEYSYGGGTISVSVDEEASPPVTGQFDLTFNGKTKSGAAFIVFV